MCKNPKSIWIWLFFILFLIYFVLLIIQTDTSPFCETCDLDSPYLLDYLRKMHLFPPEYIYNITSSSSYKIPNAISEMERNTPEMKKRISSWLNSFNKTKEGFYVDIGFGVRDNSLSFIEEEHPDWSGLLIEKNPEYFENLIQNKQRKAWISDVCLTSKPKKLNISFFNEKNLNDDNYLINKTTISIECFPLFSLLSALNAKSVDLLRIADDVYKSEIEIFKSFPFDKIPIKMILIRHDKYDTRTMNELRNYLWDKGFYPAFSNKSDTLFIYKTVYY